VTLQKAPEKVPMDKHWLRTFGLIWSGQAFSLLGSGIVQFAMVWWLTEKLNLPLCWLLQHLWHCCLMSSSLLLPALSWTAGIGAW